MSATIETMAPLRPETTSVRPWGWYALAFDDELEPGHITVVPVADVSLLLYRGESGNFHTIAPYCARRGCPLVAGTVVGDGLRCPFDGWHWNSDGTRAEGSTSLDAYPTVTAAGLVLARLGSAPSTSPGLTWYPATRRSEGRTVSPESATVLLTDPPSVAHLLGTSHDEPCTADTIVTEDHQLRVRHRLGDQYVTIAAFGPGFVQLSCERLGSLVLATTPRPDGSAIVRAVHSAESGAAPKLDAALDRALTLLDGMASWPVVAGLGAGHDISAWLLDVQEAGR
jgi:nitrite reductase/ring-hydroxylating ferredoxin subunit